MLEHVKACEGMLRREITAAHMAMHHLYMQHCHAWLGSNIHHRLACTPYGQAAIRSLELEGELGTAQVASSNQAAVRSFV